MDDQNDHNADDEDGRGDRDSDNSRGDRDGNNGRDGRDNGQHRQGRAQTKQPTKLCGTGFRNISRVQPKVRVLYFISLQATGN